MCLCVINEPEDPVGDICVCVHLMRGEYDDRLVWPFRGDITVQVVDQSSDQEHLEETIKFSDKSSISSCSRVTSGERAESGCEKAFFSLIYTQDDTIFVKYMYVKDDCVRFRVTKVLVTS